MSEETGLRRVGIVFSGGPAPAANAVIAAAASALRRDGCEVIGILRGYAGLLAAEAGGGLREGEHYRAISDVDLRGLRNGRGVLIGTSRGNPGKAIMSASDLHDAEKTRGLRAAHAALCELDLDGLISIGGDGS